MQLLPLLGGAASGGGHGDEYHTSFFSQLPVYAKTPIILAVIATIIYGGRRLLRPVFRVVAATGLRELFTATALLVVVGIAVLMSFIDLSPALGTFIGGVVLADNEFRHELESDLEPFKGLLLGLFFITVGAGIDFALFAGAPVTVLGLVLLLMISKTAIVFAIASWWKISLPHRWTLSLSLGQAGEFGFVLMAAIVGQHLLPTETARFVTLIIALSMALTPLLFVLNDQVIQPRFSGIGDSKEMDDPSGGHGKPVVIAGFGRFGQLAGRMLMANGFNSSILDLDVDNIETLRKHGLEVYYGDAERHDLLAIAGCETAKVLIIAVDDADKSIEIAELAMRHFPNLKIIARASDPRHGYALLQMNVEGIICEAEHGGIGLGKAALIALGFSPWRAERAARKFRKHQQETHRQLFEVWEDESASLLVQRQRVGDLETMLELDDAETERAVDKAWQTGLLSESQLDQSK